MLRSTNLFIGHVTLDVPELQGTGLVVVEAQCDPAGQAVQVVLPREAA